VLKGFFLKKTLYFLFNSVFKFGLTKPSLTPLPGLSHLSAPAYLVEPNQVASVKPTGRTPSRTSSSSSRPLWRLRLPAAAALDSDELR
jgi:hypothetical protein